MIPLIRVKVDFAPEALPAIADDDDNDDVIVVVVVVVVAVVFGVEEADFGGGLV